MKKISVIIPLYNAEKYIIRCLDSIFNQKFNDFEVIIIDDGSTDNSYNIVKEYIKNRKNVKLYSQKNYGPAITRNNGINYANSEYIMFIDSDDYIDLDYFSTFYENINDTNYDAVFAGFKKTNGKKIIFSRKLGNEEFSKYLCTGPVSKIIKTDYLRRNNISFLNTNSSEDVYFTLSLFINNARIKTIDYVGYNYYENNESITQTLHKGFNQNIKIIEFLDSINFKKNINVELNQYFIIRYCITYLLYGGRISIPNKFMKEYKKLFSWLSKNIPNYKNNKNIKIFGPKGEDKKVGFIIFMFILLHKLNLINIFSKFYCRGK